MNYATVLTGLQQCAASGHAFRRATALETTLALLLESAVSVNGRSLSEEGAKAHLEKYTNGLLRETISEKGYEVHRYKGVSQDPKRIAPMAHQSTDYHDWDNDRFLMTPAPKEAEDFDDVRLPPRMAAHLNDERRSFTSAEI